MKSTELNNIKIHDLMLSSPLPTPLTPLLDLDPFTPIHRLVSNPLVRGYSNLSVQSDEGAHFVPYGRGHVHIANQPNITQLQRTESSSSNLNIDIPSSFFSSESEPALDIATTPIHVKSKVERSPDTVDTDTSTDDSSTEPLPNDVETDTKYSDTSNNQVSPHTVSVTKIEIAKQNLSNLLKEWKLEKYIKILIHEMGYDDIEDWKDISMDELGDEMNFKPGHAKRFIRKTKAYFERLSLSQ